MKNKQLLRAAALCLAWAPGAAVLASPAAAAAQQVKATTQPRVVEGHVVAKGANVPGAVVYLKDTKTLAVRSFIADGSGAYHFGQLAQTTDYEVWAEGNGQRSKTKRISSFDNKNTYDFTLEL